MRRRKFLAALGGAAVADSIAAVAHSIAVVAQPPMDSHPQSPAFSLAEVAVALVVAVLALLIVNAYLVEFDGGFVLVKWLEHPLDPSKVGQEEYVFFNEVRSAE